MKHGAVNQRMALGFDALAALYVSHNNGVS